MSKNSNTHRELIGIVYPLRVHKHIINGSDHSFFEMIINQFLALLQKEIFLNLLHCTNTTKKINNSILSILKVKISVADKLSRSVTEELKLRQLKHENLPPELYLQH